MHPQSDAILDSKTGEVLVYSELLKGNRIVMSPGYTMHPQSGLLLSKDGNTIDLVELLTDVGTPTDLSSYYTKSEVDDKISNIQNVIMENVEG